MKKRERFLVPDAAAREFEKEERRAAEIFLPGLAPKVRAWREERRMLLHGTKSAQL
jgi:hypothetical protein